MQGGTPSLWGQGSGAPPAARAGGLAGWPPGSLRLHSGSRVPLSPRTSKWRREAGEADPLGVRSQHEGCRGHISGPRSLFPPPPGLGLTSHTV